MSSVAGLHGYPGLSTYCATKHAIEAVSSVLRHELVKFDISVVTVQPGDFSKATHLLGTNHNIFLRIRLYAIYKFALLDKSPPEHYRSTKYMSIVNKEHLV